MKVRINLTLDGEGAVAFEKAHQAWVARWGGQAPHHSRASLAAFLLTRSAAAYAVAPADDLTRWWKFDLRPVTPDERVIEELLLTAARPPRV